MKIAAIDLGTNTFHLLIAMVTRQGRYQELARQKIDVKLGTGKSLQEYDLTSAAQQRAVQAMLAFKRLTAEHRVQRIHAVGTSAMRSAQNSDQLLQKIQDQTGINVEIISGQQEAELIYKGVQKSGQLNKDVALIMDIGGGSVEFILCDARRHYWSQSFEIGAQRLLDSFHQHDPILLEELDRLEEYLTTKLLPLFQAANSYQPTKLIGTSGAFTALLSMHKAQKISHSNGDINRHDFEYLYANIRNKSHQERLVVPGLHHQRVDLIVVSSAMIRFILTSIGINRIGITNHSIKEGILFSIVEGHIP